MFIHKITHLKEKKLAEKFEHCMLETTNPNSINVAKVYAAKNKENVVIKLWVPVEF